MNVNVKVLSLQTLSCSCQHLSTTKTQQNIPFDAHKTFRLYKAHVKVCIELNFQLWFQFIKTTSSKHPHHFRHWIFPWGYFVWPSLCLILQVSPILTIETPEFYNPPTLTDRDSALQNRCLYVTKVDLCLVTLTLGCPNYAICCHYCYRYHQASWIGQLCLLPRCKHTFCHSPSTCHL